MRFFRSVNLLHANKTPVFSQLLQQYGRRVGQTAIDKNYIKRPLFRLPFRQSSGNGHRIINAQFLPDSTGFFVKRLIIFQRDNGRGQSGQHRCRIARATGNIQHHIFGLNIGQFNQQCQSGRGQHGAAGLTGCALQLQISIGQIARCAANKGFAWNAVHLFGDAVIANASGLELTFDHIETVFCR